MAVLIPELLWAQRKDVLYLTIDLQDCDPEPVVTVTNADGHGKLEFKGSAGGHTYETTVNLFSEVKPEDALIAITPRHIFVKLPKAVDDADHWPRLTDEKVKNGHIKVDWSKYLDQDDEESGADKYTPDTESMNPMAQGGMGGMGGGGGMDMASMMAGMGGGGGMGGMGGMAGMMGGMGGGGAGGGGMDMAKLQAMMAAQGGAGGMGDMGGMGGDEGDDAEDDSDDDDLPDLEG